MHKLATGQLLATVCCVALLPQLLYRSIGANGQHQPGDETCETLPSEIHLIKGMGAKRGGFCVEVIKR